MFTSPTVIIIGAGSSVDYSLPLGKALWDSIIRDCDQLPQHLYNFISNSITPSADVYLRETSLDNPKAYAFFSLMRDARGAIEHQQAKALAETIKGANVHDNVDDFVRDHPSLKKPMQALIAGTLFEHLYLHDPNNRSAWNLRLFFERRLGPNDNWIRHFVGLCRNHLQQVQEGEGVFPVTVISFNYDRLMETVLREFWARSETPYPPFDGCFEFAYPYGAFSELPRQVSSAGPWLVKQSEQIAITGSGPSPQKTVARNALKEADEIFMLGFSCLGTNMNWLGLNEKLGRKVFAQNYKDQDQRLARVLTSINAQSDNGSMIELVRNGFFEQKATMPLIDPNTDMVDDEVEVQ